MSTTNPVIIPVRTGLAMTRATMESVAAQDIDGGVAPIVIDNDSGDCAPFIRSLNCVTMSYRPDKGLHYVWNRALTLAFTHMDAQYVLVINNDIEMRPDTYRLLVADGGAFVTGIGVDTRAQTAHTHVENKSLHPTFSCFLIRRETWQRVGQFNEAFYAWAGDCDYHVRLHRAGIKAYALDLPFYHIGSGTLKHTKGSPEHERLCKIADADRATFERMYGCIPGEPAYEELFR